MREFARGHKKLVIILAVIFGIPLLGLAIFLIPFIILGGLYWLAHRYIKNSKLRMSTMGLLLIPTLFFGTAYGAAILNPSSSPTPTTQPIVSFPPSQPNIQPSPTLVPSTIPSLAPTLSPTSKPKTTVKPTVQPTKAPTQSNTQPQPINNSGGDKDCEDFTTHAQAQSYFISKGGSPSYNADRLDSDGDGIACENLP